MRHGHTDAVGRRLVGRLPGIHLSSEGQHEAELLPERLRPFSPTAIYTSPLERARETALPAARRLDIPLHDCPGLIEVDFGDWTGCSFVELEQDLAWVRYNSRRERAIVPNGENAREIQARIRATLDTLASLHSEQTIAAVTHAELIRAAVLYCRCLSLDRFTECEIAPASITALTVSRCGKLLLTNDMEASSHSRHAPAVRAGPS